jgi:uncharacterized protein YegL
MKTDFSKLPREEVEARITSMLFGEMPADEARELMEFVAGDVELMRLHDELKATISLVQEASRSAESLSERKREKLLESFKVVPIEPRQNERGPAGSWLALAAMIAFLFVISGLMLPSLSKSKSKARRVAKLMQEKENAITLNLPDGGRNEALPANAEFGEQRDTLASNPAHAVNAPAAAAEQTATATENERNKVQKALETQYTIRYFSDADRDDAAVPQTKIELPKLAEADSPAEGKASDWRFQAGQFRGYGGLAVGGDGGRKPGQAAAENGQTTLGFGVTVGKDLNLLYSEQPSAVADQQNHLVGRDFSSQMPRPDGFADAGGIGNKEAIDLFASTDAKKTDSSIAPSTGLPVAPPVAVSASSGLMRLPSAQAGTGGLTGANVAGDALQQAPEQQVALGTGLKLLESKREAGGRSLTVDDLGQKNEVVALDLSKTPEANARDRQVEDLSKKSEIAERFANVPSEKVAARTDEFQSERIQASTLVQDARSLIELGRTQEAEKLLKQAQKNDPDHRAAGYYLNLIKEQKYAQEARKRETSTQDRLAQVEKSSQEPLGRELPATPNPYDARTKVSRELEKLKQLRDSIQTRITQESVDAKIPKSGIVEMVDRAETNDNRKPSVLGRLFGRGEQRLARVEISKDAQDITPLMPSTQSATYDPYFIQSEAEKIRSKTVLSEVVDELKLDQKWSASEGRPLTREEAVARLGKTIKVEQAANTSLMEIRARAEKGAEAAEIVNKVAEVYQKQRASQRASASKRGVQALTQQLQEQERLIAQKEADLTKLRESEPEVAAKRTVSNAATPQPEVLTVENAFSTFSLNVSDVSFKLAAASLEKGLMPDVATVRSEEFINAFDYRDPEPQGAPVGFVWERARYPFAQDRDLVRFSVKTAASGRQAGRPLNLVLLLDSSGSMERADRVRILQECLKTLAAQLRPEDRISVVAFARTARLWVDGLPGSQAGELPTRVGNLAPEGGTNLEEAMRVAYETARKHFSASGVNRVVLLTDGAANLGDVEPESLKKKVEAERKKGIALDCFGIGWEGLNDELLETLSRNGDGRYGFVNSTEAAGSEFAGQLAGALKVAASDVKVQVEWNPKRVTAFRQIGYAKHQLTKEQFRDNTVDAAEIGAAEAGNALYTVQVNPAGEGPLGTVRVRFKVPGTNDYREHEWPLNYEGAAKALENSNYSLRLAGTASAFSEFLISNPYATEVTTDRLLAILSGVPERFAPDPRPKKLEWMIRQAKSVAGR